MPYAPGFERALRGIAHGWKPRKGSLKKIGQDKAKAMLDEAEGVEHEARKRGLDRVSRKKD